MGRLAAVVAKKTLEGHKVSVLRCEQMDISGNFFRNKLKFLAYLRKRCNVNPARGPFHFRAPSKIFKKAVRGMLPHKLHRGQKALDRLKTYEGVPPFLDSKKRLVVPHAMRMLCLKPGRKYCSVGRLASEVGWKYKNVVSSLEAKRIAKGRKTAVLKGKLRKITQKAEEKIAPISKPYVEVMKSYGY